MKLKKIIALFLVAVLAASFISCGETQTVSSPDASSASPVSENADPVSQPVSEITVTDMIGRELTVVPGSYERVVCIGAGALRMYLYVCDVSLLCGVEDIDNLSLESRPAMFDSSARPYILAYGENLKSLPSCGVGGPNAQAAEAEKILTCAPDIIISEYEDVEKADALQQQTGVPVVTLRTGKGGVFDEPFKGSMRLLGEIFGTSDRAEELVAFVEAEQAEITRRTKDVAEADKPSVYICGLGNWGTTNHLTTAQDYIVFDVANVKNAVDGLASPGIQPIDAEKFASIGGDVDVMIIDSAAVKNIKPLYAEDKTMFDGCKAWKNGEVYLEPAYNAYYTNYEIALINTWFIAKAVYPDLFADIDVTAKANEVTKAFLGVELADEISGAKASFGGWRKIDTASFFE